MESALNKIDAMAKELRDALTDFLLNHSEIEPCRSYTDEHVGFSPDGDRNYAYLDEEGRKVQAALSERYGRFYAAFDPLLQGQPDDVLSKMSKFNNIIVRTIEHRLTWCENTQQALDRALTALDGELDLLKGTSGKKGS